MSFFNRKPKSDKQYNRFASHVDVLQRMANNLSNDVIENIQGIIKYNKPPTYVVEHKLHIYIDGSWLGVDLGLSPYYYSIEDSYGMESIPKFQWDNFINALYPHFETIFYDQLAKKISYKDYSVNVFKSKYIKEEFDYDDNLIRLVYPLNGVMKLKGRY